MLHEYSSKESPPENETGPKHHTILGKTRFSSETTGCGIFGPHGYSKGDLFVDRVRSKAGRRSPETPGLKGRERVSNQEGTVSEKNRLATSRKWEIEGSGRKSGKRIGGWKWDEGNRQKFNRIKGFKLGLECRRGRLPLGGLVGDVALMRNLCGAVVLLERLRAAGGHFRGIHGSAVHPPAMMHGKTEQARGNQNGQNEQECQQVFGHIQHPEVFLSDFKRGFS
jgi:hypothetical protein